MDPSSERSLISAIIPPDMLHINAVESVAFQNLESLLTIAALTSTIVHDFYCKASGMSQLFSSGLSRLPFGFLNRSALVRQLKLNCLNEYYSDLWSSFITQPTTLNWSNDHPSLKSDGADQFHPNWSRTSGLRYDYPRRLALVETDVLVARAFSLTLEQLIKIYSVYFPVLQENESTTWYDNKGRIVWTGSKGLPGVGYVYENGRSPSFKDWQCILESNPSELVCKAVDDTMSDGPKTVERRFVGPFFKCDRIEDYKRAWAHFEKLEQEGKL